jgi:hypothetical protein
MTYSDSDLIRERLQQLAGSFGDTQHVDVAAARHRGRRVLRARRFAVGLACTASATAVAVAVSVTAGGVPGRAPTPHTRGPAVAAAYSDPLIQTASFGWLPEGFAVVGYVADDQGQASFELDAGLRGQLTGGASLALTDYGRGPEPGLPDLPGGVPATPIPAPPVGGHPAYWLTPPTLSPDAQLSFELRWQYAPGSWADLQAAGLSATSVADLTAAASHIAGSVTFGQSLPVPMPLHVTGVPGGLTARRTTFTTGPQPSALIYYAGPALNPADSLQISVVPPDQVPGMRGGPALPKGKPVPAGKAAKVNTVIDGHPAYDSQLDDPNADSATLLVVDVNGFNVGIDASGQVLTELAGSGGLAGLFSRITVYGGDRAAWTTTPVN